MIDQSPFPGGPAVGSTLTVILLVTGKLNCLSFVPACSREKNLFPQLSQGCDVSLNIMQSQMCISVDITLLLF